MSITIESTIKTFGGKLLKLSHESKATNCKMNVNVFLPPQYEQVTSTDKKIPVLIYLSGLTCTPMNVTEKGGWYQWASKYGFALVFPDTSPRGDMVTKDDKDCWYVGSGAGFYINAVTDGWKDNYQMYTYIDSELPFELGKNFEHLDFKDNISITGHSMGGFGAILHFLRNPAKYKSCSAFSPASNIYENPWTKASFTQYLGPQEENQWAQYDVLSLLKQQKAKLNSNILIHVGLADSFYDLLKCGDLLKASLENDYVKDQIDLNEVEGYDHSYYFISSFVEDHARHHATKLGLKL